jgi:hypothetical protein
VVNGAIHRVIEYQAASRPDAPALTEGPRTLTYRELNQRANVLARRLVESGLTRGAIAMVRMPRSIDLAVVLLATLKAGAAYAWVEPGSRQELDLPANFCILRRRNGDEQGYLALDIRSALAACASRPSPNLPILTRGSDLACVLLDAGGNAEVLVPHATITALPPTLPTDGGEWSASAGTFDLWLTLMTGAALSLGAATPVETTSAAA